jgi:tetratricopeptide (TPR) repeat protein
MTASRHAARRTHRRLPPPLVGLGVLLWLLVCRGPAVAEERDGAYAPYENLIEVLADFARHLRDDLYRFPPPTDVTGGNLFAVTLTRLENFRTLHPTDMPDVVSFAKAEAYIRLGDYAKADRAFQAVARLESPLRPLALERGAVAAAMARAAELPERADTLEGRIASLRAKLDAWDTLVRDTDGGPYESVCRREEERIEGRLLATIIDNRAWLDGAADTAIGSAAFMVAKHSESAHAAAHALRLADLQAALARTCAGERTEGKLDEVAFGAHVAAAMEIYARIASLDGIPEKAEAEGKLRALEAYRHTVLSDAQ